MVANQKAKKKEVKALNEQLEVKIRVIDEAKAQRQNKII
jgi:hypothetical protein